MNFNPADFTKILKKINDFKRRGKSTLRDWPEDLVIFNIAKHKADKIKFIDFYFPLGSLYNIKRRKKKQSVIHFENLKNEMLEINKNLCLNK
jgi:hypothetical protein